MRRRTPAAERRWPGTGWPPDDRIDLVADRYLGDPQAWWRICDANAALDPDALIGPDNEGRVIVIGVPRM